MTQESTRTPSEHESYITLDSFRSEKGDPGGFGFGGANGVTGGFGVGGAGPQPGLEPHRQAHYRKRTAPSAQPTHKIVRSGAHTGNAQHDHDDDYPSWLDGFPHSFHGWGPTTPDSHPDEHASEHAATEASQPSIGFLEMTVMSAADPFATGLLWKRRN